MNRSLTVSMLSLVAAVTLSGCDAILPIPGVLEKEYEWTQLEDGTARKAPIVYNVRIEFNGSKATIKTHAKSADGFVDIRSDTYDCEVFNADAFKCHFAGDDFYTMENGVLHQVLWSTERTFRTKYVLFGRAL